MKSALIYLVIFLTLATPGHCGEAAEATVPNVGTGLPVVTSEQFISKLVSIVQSIHTDAVVLSPQLTILIFIGGGILGIFIAEARKTVAWSIVGMLLVLWGPKLIALVYYYANK